ncbi:hypothetical protein [Brucella tritici]|uniref:hypothetical protein n=1 Tax=Brucella tritici TaxID=94626 RepID=UPI003D6CB1EF
MGKVYANGRLWGASSLGRDTGRDSRADGGSRGGGNKNASIGGVIMNKYIFNLPWLILNAIILILYPYGLGFDDRYFFFVAILSPFVCGGAWNIIYKTISHT